VATGRGDILFGSGIDGSGACLSSAHEVGGYFSAQSQRKNGA
jgi:hypothetical protein